MRIDRRFICSLAGLMFLTLQVHAVELAQATGAPAPAQAQPPTPATMAEYQTLLWEYQIARQPFDQQNARYWNRVREKRSARNAKRAARQQIVLDDYVLDQPPVYTGPPKPKDPSGATPERKYVPIVADFLKAAAEHFKFTPQLPASESEYKRAYARLASAAGLTKDQVVRIYAFESSGNGKYDVQAGLEYPKPDARAVSTALGYNQLLSTNSVELMAEKGNEFIKSLKSKLSQASGERKQSLEKKIAVVERMVAFAKSVPDRWAEHENLAKTPRGLAIHAMVLDVDVGPMLQLQKLMDSVNFARRKGYTKPLTASELEMMNLTGDGNGYDMISLPPEMREKVPTSNFFQLSGYQSNSVARKNNLASTLIGATDKIMDTESKLPGALEMAAAFDRGN